MLFVSILTSDRKLDPELWATLWQGNPPPSITIVGAYNLTNDKRVIIWDGQSPADVQYIDRLNEVGLLETYPAIDRTQAFQATFAKDLDGFRAALETRGISESQIESAYKLRSQSKSAPNRHQARVMARQWYEDESRLDDR